MCVLRISLFGKFSISYNDQFLDNFAASKLQELFCYLLLYRDRSHSRESLASLFWEDCLTAQSKKRLRQVLWQLRTVLHALLGSRLDEVLQVEPDWIRCDTGSYLWLDVAAFEQACTRFQEIPGQQLSAEQAQTCQNAVQLYKGDLLEGWYQDWCIYERERLQSMYLTMLDKLIIYSQICRQYETGILYGQDILHYDPAHERTHRHLMYLHYLTGDRTTALRQYELCVTTLWEEFGIRPDHQTERLYKQIQADIINEYEPILFHSTPISSPTVPPSTELLYNLKQFQTVLSDLHGQVQDCISFIEQLYNNCS